MLSMMIVPDHPDVTAALRTGYPTYAQPDAEEADGEHAPKYDEPTIDAVFEAFNDVLKNYLSDNLRTEVWNKVSRLFPG